MKQAKKNKHMSAHLKALAKQEREAMQRIEKYLTGTYYIEEYKGVYLHVDGCGSKMKKHCYVYKHPVTGEVEIRT